MSRRRGVEAGAAALRPGRRISQWRREFAPRIQPLGDKSTVYFLLQPLKRAEERINHPSNFPLLFFLLSAWEVCAAPNHILVFPSRQPDVLVSCCPDGQRQG